LFGRQKEMKNSDFDVRVAYAYEAPSKPPARVLVGDLFFKNNSPGLIYFLLPYFLDEPLVIESNRVEAIEVFKAPLDGGVYFLIHRNPAFFIFPLNSQDSLSFPLWRFMTWSKENTSEIWAAKNVLINKSKSLVEWGNEMKFGLPGVAYEENALLMAWEPVEPVSILMEDIVAKFSIRLM
jgi:hypothetical protein